RLHVRVAVVRPVLILRPLPDVSRHVVETETIGGKRADRRRAFVTVRLEVLPGELALPGVGLRTTVRFETLAPRVGGSVEPAARRELPLRLARQRLPRPSRIGLGIFVRDVDDRMLIASFEVALRSLRMLPARAWNVGPPCAWITQRNPPYRLAEHERAGDENRRVHPRIGVRIRRAFGERDVARRLDELAKRRVGHRMRIHPEPGNRDPSNRPLLRIEVVRSHRERATRNPDHAREDGFGDGARSVHAHAASSLPWRWRTSRVPK